MKKWSVLFLCGFFMSVSVLVSCQSPGTHRQLGPVKVVVEGESAREPFAAPDMRPSRQPAAVPVTESTESEPGSFVRPQAFLPTGELVRQIFEDQKKRRAHLSKAGFEVLKKLPVELKADAEARLAADGFRSYRLETSIDFDGISHRLSLEISGYDHLANFSDRIASSNLMLQTDDERLKVIFFPQPRVYDPDTKAVYLLFEIGRCAGEAAHRLQSFLVPLPGFESRAPIRILGENPIPGWTPVAVPINWVPFDEDFRSDGYTPYEFCSVDN